MLVLLILFTVFPKVPVRCLCVKDSTVTKICPYCKGLRVLPESSFTGMALVSCTLCGGSGKVCAFCNNQKQISLLDNLYIRLFRRKSP